MWRGMGVGCGFEFMGSIFYVLSIVGCNTCFIGTKMGATLPVLKNEIRDFFFARLGTGRTSQNRRATMRLRMYVIGKRLGVGIFAGVIFWGRYFIIIALLVVIHIPWTQKWAAVFCGPFRDKRLIQYFSRCDVLASTPHS